MKIDDDDDDDDDDELCYSFLNVMSLVQPLSSAVRGSVTSGCTLMQYGTDRKRGQSLVAS